MAPSFVRVFSLFVLLVLSVQAEEDVVEATTVPAVAASFNVTTEVYTPPHFQNEDNSNWNKDDENTPEITATTSAEHVSNTPMQPVPQQQHHHSNVEEEHQHDHSSTAPSSHNNSKVTVSAATTIKHSDDHRTKSALITFLVPLLGLLSLVFGIVLIVTTCMRRDETDEGYQQVGLKDVDDIVMRLEQDQQGMKIV